MCKINTHLVGDCKQKSPIGGLAIKTNIAETKCNNEEHWTRLVTPAQ